MIRRRDKRAEYLVASVKCILEDTPGLEVTDVSEDNRNAMIARTTCNSILLSGKKSLEKRFDLKKE